jgi:hypothetical protein
MKPDVYPGIACPEDLSEHERCLYRCCGEHLTRGGPEFCIFCLRARSDRYHSALRTISETDPCPCPCCGDHEAVTRAKTALEVDP